MGSNKEAKQQVKSKQRVAEHGEVFTNEREVNAMCDLVAQECDRIDARFLEPACGDGNFLAEILRRKLETVKRLYKRSAYDYERYSVLAVSSVYGIDILQDNVVDCRERLYKIWDKEYKAVCKSEVNDECRLAVKYILEKNILCGNALSLMQVDDSGNDTEDYITFAEWSMVSGANFKRRDFRLDILLKENDEDNDGQFSLWADDPMNPEYWERDEETKAYIPKPIKEYPLTHYRRVKDNG